MILESRLGSCGSNRFEAWQMIAATSQQSARTARQHIHGTCWISLVQGMSSELMQKPQGKRERVSGLKQEKGSFRQLLSRAPETPLTLAASACSVHLQLVQLTLHSQPGSDGSPWCHIWARGWWDTGLKKAPPHPHEADCTNITWHAHLRFSPCIYWGHHRFRNLNSNQQFRNQGTLTFALNWPYSSSETHHRKEKEEKKYP